MTNSFRRSAALSLNELDERCVPATARFTQTNLVSDQAGVAAITDPNLVNPWGVAINPTGAFWVSDNGTAVTTLYQGDANGTPLSVVSGLPMVTGLGPVTGQVYNPTSDFVVSATGGSGPAAFIFVAEDGSISAWNPNVPPPAPATKAVTVVPAGTAVYKGVALARNAAGGAAGNFLYAADFRNDRINVFTATFQPTVLDGSFTDPSLPAGYAPFNIQAIGGKLYVTYAVQDATGEDDAPGAGRGIVDVFDTAGHFLQRLVTGGELNSPWGLALAPAGFGTFGGDLLVGNFGDGRINAYDPATGAFKGTLQTAQGTPLEIDGLWALTFGNGSTAGNAGSLYFTAGPDDETHGLFGSLSPAPGPAVLVGAPQFAVGADAGGGPVAKSFTANQAPLLPATTAFDPSFTGGVRVAAADFSGDGTVDIAVGTGPGSATQVKILDGKTGATLTTIDPFESTFTGGVYVAAGDLDGDGRPELVISPDEGGGPRVRVFRYNLPVDIGSTGGLTQVADFLGIEDPNFRGGARVAVGDLNGDGSGDLVVAAGFGGGPRVAAFSGPSLSSVPVKLFGDFLAFEPDLRNGAFVAAGDVNGDGVADVVAGGGPGGGPRVTIFDGASLLANAQVQLANFFAGDTTNRGGVRVAVKNLDNDNKADLIVGSGTGAGSRVTAYLAPSLLGGSPSELFHTDEFPGFTGGVFVG